MNHKAKKSHHFYQILVGVLQYLCQTLKKQIQIFLQQISVTLQRFNAVCVSYIFRDLLVNDSG